MHTQHSLLIFIRLARPKEAFQPIFSMTGHQVNVQVRDALADSVVDGDKGALCLQAAFDRTLDPLGVLEEGSNQCCRQIRQGLHMDFRDEQAMAGKERARIEKRQRGVVLKDDGAGPFTPDDLTKTAVLL